MAVSPITDPGRVDFRRAQRIHRMSARFRSLPAVLAIAVMGIPLSAYLSPVILGIAVVLVDVINLVVRLPDLGQRVWNVADRLFNASPGVAEAAAMVMFLWVLPGVVLLLCVYILVRARLRSAGGDVVAASMRARKPRMNDPAELGLVHLVQEFAIAASIATPRVLVVPRASNATVFGADPDHATVVVGRRLLDDLDREATQGVIARLIASIVDGDLGLATNIGSVYVTYGLLTTGWAALTNRSALKRLRMGIRALFGRPTATESVDHGGLGALLGLKVDDDYDPDGKRLWFSMFTMSSFIGAAVALINQTLAGPLLVFAWRSRVHLGDALTVDLGRNPTSLARALRVLGDGRGMPGSAWLELSMVAGSPPTSRLDPRYGRSLSDTGLAPSITPPSADRIARLESMGARGQASAGSPSTPHSTIRRGSRRRDAFFWPLVLVAWAAGLLVVAALVFAIALISSALVFSGAGLVHHILRAIAGA